MEYLEILKDTFLTDDRYMYIVNGVIFSIGITLFSAILGIINRSDIIKKVLHI